MRIGLIGAGRVGGTLARHWSRAGHELLLSSRHPEHLAELVESLGPPARAGSPEDAAEFGEIIVLAVPLGATAELGRALSARVAGKVLVDTTNPFPRRDGADADRALRSAGGSLAFTRASFPGADAVKAFNTVFVSRLRRPADDDAQRLALPLAGPADACAAVSLLIRDAGFTAVVVGGPERASLLDPGGPLWNRDLTAPELRTLLAQAGLLSPSG